MIRELGMILFIIALFLVTDFCAKIVAGIP